MVEQTINQLQALQVDGQYIELRALKRQPNDQMTPQGSFYMNGNVQEAIDWANAQSTNSVEVFVGVNPRARQNGSKDAVQLVTALYTDLDLDGQGVDGAIHEVLNRSIPANRINKSGRGIHAYWHIHPTDDKELWRKTNVAIQQRFADLRADKAVATDESRVLRLVPYPNMKHDAGPVECVYSAKHKYTLEEVAEAFGVIAPAEEAQPEQMREVGESLLTALLRKAIVQGTPGNRNNAGLWLACQLRDNRVSENDAIEVMHQLVDNTDYIGGSYSYGEAEATLRSIYKTTPREPIKPRRQARTELLVGSAHHTDAGNAENFAALFGNDVRFNHTTNKWLLWDGVRWANDGRNKVEQLANQTARAMLNAATNIDDDDKRKRAVLWALGTENLQRSKAMLIKAQSLPEIATEASEFDIDTFLAAVKNGTLDLQTGELRESRREDYITKQLGTVYDATADCPRWKQFLAEVFNNDEELIQYIQRAIGYSLTGDTREQCLFLLHGNGNNGKSTFLETIALLMGDYAETSNFDTFDADAHKGINNDVAKLKGARCVTIIETEEGSRLNEAKVKAVTGQDRIDARFLYGEFFTFRPQFKIWLAMNHLPLTRGQDEGIWRRIKLIKFNQNFAGREDKTLDAKFKAELPGILNWALAGLRSWLDGGMREPASVTTAVREYRIESDVVAQWIEDVCEIGEQHTMIVETGYLSYRSWAESRSDKPMTQQMWSRRMSERGYISTKIYINGKQVRAYKGVKTDLSGFARH